MIQAFQFNNLPTAIVLWVLVYSCDYYLNLYGNRLRTSYASAHIGIDGSYELNPYYQRDIDSNNRFSRRFLFMLVLFSVYLAVMWYIAQTLNLPEAFSIAAGVVLLLEGPVIATHVQNISMYTFLKTPDAVWGKITYARWITLTLAGRIFGYWLVAYATLFLLTGSWLFVGGALSMLSLFIRYSSRGQRLRDHSPTVVAPKDAVPAKREAPVGTAVSSDV